MATNHFNDPNISDDERLLRRIHLVHMVEGDSGAAKVSTAAFKDQELSVNIESKMLEAGRLPEDSLRNNPNDLLLSITAHTCRDNNQLVGPDPVPTESAHGYVFGKKGKPVQRRLRDSAEWIVPSITPMWSKIEGLKRDLGISTNDSGDL
ncbi:MAG: hypothetical protein IT170_15445 [Bryobacterales bacterium]|nr:hypothetical protein [Bryobacterales bacterium]